MRKSFYLLSILCFFLLLDRLYAQPPFSAPTPNCAPGTGTMLWSQSIHPSTGDPSTWKLLCTPGSLTYTIPMSFYPSLLTSGVPVIVNISEVVSYDGYVGRSGAGVQSFERWRIVFRKSSVVVETTGYTNDLTDGTEQASWVGSLGSVYLPTGADEIVLEHWCVGNPGAPTFESVVPVSVCLSVAACPADCPTTVIVKN